MRRRTAGVVVLALAASLVTVAGPAQAKGSALSGGVPTHVVVLREGTPVERTMSAHGLRPIEVVRSAFHGFTAKLRPDQVERLRRDAGVHAVIADVVIGRIPRGRTQPGPVKRLLDGVTGPFHPLQIIPTGVERIGGLESPTANIDGNDDRVDADIAIVDSGIDITHADINLAGGKGCAGPLGVGYVDAFDGHGTHVAGIAAAKDNDYGVVGVAPGARIWAVKYSTQTGAVPLSALVCAAEWLVEHASVIDVANMSFGFLATANPGSCEDAPPALDDAGAVVFAAACAIIRAGITVVAAAGNDDHDASLQIPASIDDVIAVSAFSDHDGAPGATGTPRCQGGADQPDDAMGTFTNFGPEVDIAAPGVCIWSAYPTSAYEYITGTSMAAPHVAGAAALIIATGRGRTPAEVRSILLEMATPGPLAGAQGGSTEGLLSVRGL